MNNHNCKCKYTKNIDKSCDFNDDITALNICNYDRQKLLYHSCKFGQLDTIKLLYSMYPILFINGDDVYAFQLVCANGYLHIAQWMHNFFKESKYGELNINVNDNIIFEQCCRNGHLELAKWIYELSKTDDDNNVNHIRITNRLFQLCCENGRTEVAEWLYETSKIIGDKININSDDEFAFRQSCIFGHLDTAKWLYKLSETDSNTKINIHIDDNTIFLHSCRNGRLDVVQWLYELSDSNIDIDIHTNHDFALVSSCIIRYPSTPVSLFYLFYCISLFNIIIDVLHL